MSKRRTKRIGIILLSVTVVLMVGAMGVPLWTHGLTQTDATTSTPTNPARDGPNVAAPDTLKVLTLNVAHGRRDGAHQALVSTETIRANLDQIAGVLAREEPDIAALQEADGPSIWSGNFNHVEYLAERSGFSHRFRGAHVNGLQLSYGTALISRLPLQNCVSVTFAPSPPTLSKGVVIGSMAWPGRPDVTLTVASVHLDFARDSVRQSQVQEIIGLVNSAERPLLVMGDFNCEWQGSDSSLRTLASELGLRAYEPAATDLVSFPSNGKRLDWILISPELDFVHYANVSETLSDHRGVTAELRLATVPALEAGKPEVSVTVPSSP